MKTEILVNTHPWRRYFARLIDLIAIGGLIFVLSINFLVYLLPENIILINTIFGNIIVELIIQYILWVPIEALFISFFGTTPGKWLYGISVIKIDGTKLSFSESLERAIFVWVKGDAFGIPIILLITNYFGYKRLTKSETTLWDNEVNSIVVHKKWGFIRVVFVVFITALIFLINYRLQMYGS